jgi:hypothetical protein
MKLIAKTLEITGRHWAIKSTCFTDFHGDINRVQLILYVFIPMCYIYILCARYFIKTFNTRILNSKIQIPLFWLHVSVQNTDFRPSVHLKTSTPPQIFILPTPAHHNFGSNLTILPTGLHYIENIKKKNSHNFKRL